MGKPGKPKELRKVAKKVLDKKTRKKTKKIKGVEEEEHALWYLIRSKLEHIHHNILMEIKRLEKEEKDVFHLHTKAQLINTKMNWFFTSFHRKELKDLMSLIKRTEQEMKNV